MAITFVSLAGSTGSGATAVTTRASGAFSATSGNAILVFTSNYTSGRPAVSGVTDTAGNSYAYCGSGGGDAYHIIEVWLALNVTGHASNVVTVTFVSEAEFALMSCAQYSGITTSGALDDISGVTITPNVTTVHTTSAVTASTASTAQVGFFVPWDKFSITGAAAPYTYRGLYADAAVVDRIVSATGDYSISATTDYGTEANQACIAVALKGASGGEDPPETPVAMMMGI